MSVFVAFTLVVALLSAANPIANGAPIMWNDDFVKRCSTAFCLGDSTFPFIGFNTYNLMSWYSPYFAIEVLSKGADLGMTVCRTWAFNDGYHKNDANGIWKDNTALQMGPGDFSEETFKVLDHVIYQAAQHGVRLMLPFVNYWEDYGGREMYVHWSAENGGGAKKADDFYTNWKCRQYYKNAVKTILNRKNSYNGRIYKDDPAIFG